jgi:uncharacterized protein
MLTVVLLICSNTFMTVAWYGHLKHKSTPLLMAIVVSWSIAFFEYCFQVPANRYGYLDLDKQAAPVENAAAGNWAQRWWHAKFSGPQLKIIQEVITIAVFVLFNALYLKNTIRLTDWAAFGLIILAVVVMMYPRWAETNTPHKTPAVQIDQAANE